MEQTFTLDPKEAVRLARLDQERTQALAAYGALALDMEQAKRNLDTVAERQRDFVRHALMSRGIEQYENARMQAGALVVTTAEPPLADMTPRLVERTNGALIEAKD